MANVILRLTAVEAHFTPPAPPSGGVIAQFPGTGPNTSAAFLALMANMNIDTIEMAAGSYTGWHLYVRLSRAARPLLIRPAAGAAVTFAGDGTGAGLLYLGTNVGAPGYPSFATDYITMDAAGTGGSFTATGYTLGGTGLVMTGWVNHVTVNGLIVRNITGAAGGSTSHCLYVNTDDTHRGQNITANGWDIAFTGSRLVNGVQTYHTPNAQGVTLHGWTISGCHRAGYIWADGSGIDIDGWTIANCDATFDAQGTAAGSVKNCHATNSGTTTPGSGYWTDAFLTDGGGNTWS